ncbi:amidohydrolase family protein [Pseudorhodoplanes sp.]|uniref:amidohydrolase family protein n=1 Tax=Pseudorhodoplanes sp. TaxID=1934341 RepID=UPI003D0A1659
MIIDSHAHMADPKFFDRMGKTLPKSMLDPQILLDEQAKAGIDISVISGPRVMEVGVDAGRLDPTEVAKEYNDFVANLTARHSKSFVGLGIAHAFADDKMLGEMERAFRQLKLRGFLVVPRYQDEFIDSRRADSFFALCESLGAVVFVHNADGCLSQEYMQDNRLVELVGRPNEMTLLAARLVFAGHMERFPKLKLFLGRTGGAITMYAGRIQEGWVTRISRSDGIPPWGSDNLKNSFMDSLSKIYFDTQTFHPPAIRCAVDTVGASQVLLGTDFPPVPHSLLESVEDVRRSGIPEQDVAAVLGGNARTLFAI